MWSTLQRESSNGNLSCWKWFSENRHFHYSKLYCPMTLRVTDTVLPPSSLLYLPTLHWLSCVKCRGGRGSPTGYHPMYHKHVWQLFFMVHYTWITIACTQLHVAAVQQRVEGYDLIQRMFKFSRTQHSPSLPPRSIGLRHSPLCSSYSTKLFLFCLVVTICTYK